MKRGATGAGVKELQGLLNDNGADLEVDGVFGPLTEAAVRTYQEQNGLLVDGIAGTDTMGGLKGTTSAPGTETPDAGYDDNGSDLILPGNAKLYFNTDTGEHWVVYEVPDVEGGDPLLTAWRVETDQDLEAVLGPDVMARPHFSGTEADFTNMGIVDLGGVSELRPFTNIEADPFDTWVEDLSVLAQVKPWLLDDDYVALAVQASMERADGAISLEELQTTGWWKTHTAGERAWMETFHGDPATAEQILEDNRASMRYRLSQAGVDNVTDEIVNFMADQATMGAWSSSKVDSQVIALSDPYSIDVMDEELVAFIATTEWAPDTTRTNEDTVRSLLNEWLGPIYGDWDEQAIAAKAGELRNNPDAEIEFIEQLKDQRMAVLPNYTDRETSYAAAARPWETYLQGQWGNPSIDASDTTFQEIVAMNDINQAGVMARRVGFERGYDKVVTDTANGIRTSMNQGVVGAV